MEKEIIEKTEEIVLSNDLIPQREQLAKMSVIDDSVLFEEKSDTNDYEIEIIGQRYFCSPEKVLRVTRSHIKNINKSIVSLARLFFYIKDGKIYKKLGYKSLKHFCEEGLEYSDKTAQNFYKIYKILSVEFAINDKTIAKLGIVKCNSLVKLYKKGILNGSNIQFWLERADLKGANDFSREVSDAIRESIEERGEEPPQKFVFDISGEDRKIVEYALNMAKETIQTTSNSEAFIAMATEFSSSFLDQSKGNKKRVVNSLLKTIEEKTGLTIKAHDKNNQTYPPTKKDIINQEELTITNEQLMKEI